MVGSQQILLKEQISSKCKTLHKFKATSHGDAMYKVISVIILYSIFEIY